MQEAREAFRTAVYKARMGVQTFYDDLVGHAQNMAVYPDEFTIRKTFQDGIPAEMCRTLICNNNLSPEVNTVTEFLVYAICYEQSARTAIHYDQRSSCRATGQRQPVKVVQQSLPAGHKPGLGQAGNLPAARDNHYGPSLGQSAPKAMRDVPPRVGLPKAAFGGGDVGYKPGGGTPCCYNCGWTGHFSKECKALRVQVRAAHTAAVESDAESDVEAGPEKPVLDNEEVPQDIEERSAVDDAESVQIKGDEYVAVDVYDNDYYARDDEEEHMFALTEHQGDGRVLTYVEVNGHLAWTLWDSGSTTTGITPQFAHVNAIRVHELTEPLMLQLNTVGSCGVVQFGTEVKVKMLGQPTKEYVDIANFDCYDMIISTPFMHKNKVLLDFVNNKVIVNRTPLRAERVVLADTDGRLRRNAMVEEVGKELAPMASLPADAPVIMISEEEFQGTLERGDGPDRPRTAERKAVKKPDKARQPDETRAERVNLGLLECQPTSSRVKVEDLITDEVEECRQSAASAAETTDSARSFWD
ncbi:hypothetical protein C0992_008325 [Termitomyces sp. T32_za158]|nr:hypothetical protein C0992_008325 [Termitomyces sp. T32_za158]